MITDINHYIKRNNERAWQPLIEKGVHYKGISVVSLKYDEATKRSTTILLKFDAGASYPYHNHPGGEELFVVSGEVIIEGTTLGAGDYLHTPINFKHSVSTKTGGTVLFIVPEEVEIL